MFTITLIRSPTAACGRKKRSIFEDPLTGAVEDLKPSTPARYTTRLTHGVAGAISYFLDS